jgi:hypothetical protein
MVAAGAAAGLGLAAAPARAYVREKTLLGTPSAWRSPQVRLLETQDTSRDLPLDQVREAARRALGAWSYPAVPCTSLQLELGPSTGAPGRVGADMTPSLIFREDTWCDGAVCHDPATLATTSVFIKSRPGQPDDGEIVDADIEVNAVAFRWTIVPDNGQSPVPGALDLASLLTHELGHLIGLDHNCWRGVDPGARDHLGNPVPDCRLAPAELREATMYPGEPRPGDIGARSLAADDLLGVCAIYPRNTAPVPDAGPGAPADGGSADLAAGTAMDQRSADAGSGGAPDTGAAMDLRQSDPAGSGSPDAGPGLATDAAGPPVKQGSGGCSCTSAGSRPASGWPPWAALGASAPLLLLRAFRRRPANDRDRRAGSRG